MGWMDTLGKIGNVIGSVLPTALNLGFGIANQVKALKGGGGGMSQREQYSTYGTNPYPAENNPISGLFGNIGSMIKKGVKTFNDFKSGNFDKAFNRIGKIKNVFHQGVSNIGNLVGAFSSKAGNKINAWNQKANAVSTPYVQAGLGLANGITNMGKEMYKTGKDMYKQGVAVNRANTAQYRSGDKIGAVENGINSGLAFADQIANRSMDMGRRSIQLLNNFKKNVYTAR